MSLRKSPIRTAALLAACRANARKSTGPRTPQGKARTRLNGLQHGCCCHVLHRLLPEGLSFSERLRYNWIRRAIEHCFRPETPRQREWALRLAIQAWCQVAKAGQGKNGRPGNVTENTLVRDERRLLRIQYQAASRSLKQSLAFWTQARGGKARLGVGEKWPWRPQGLFVGWYGDGRVNDWSAEPAPDPELDPMGFWHWQREMKRQFRSFRRAQAREARRQEFAVALAARYQTASLHPSLPAGAIPSAP